MISERLRCANTIQRDFVFNRDNGQCHYCGIDIALKGFHVDHMHPFSKGGETDINNLVASCYMCNIAKHTMDYDKFKQRIIQKGLDWRRRRYFVIKSRFSKAKLNPAY